MTAKPKHDAAPEAPVDGTFIAVQSGVAEVDGEPFVFTAGRTLVRTGHPLLRAVPDYFEPTTDHVHYDVEQATAAPGEKRGD